MRALVAVVLVVTSGVLPGFLSGAVGVQLREDLALGEAALGLAIGVFFSAAALTSVVLGRTAERLGPSRSMRASATLSGLVMVSVAATARTFPVLLALLAIGGAANALAQPAANVFVARTIDAGRLGIAFAVKQSGVPAATLLGGLAVPTIAVTVGWRWTYAAGAVLAVAGLLATPSSASVAQRRDVVERDRVPRGPRPRLAVAPLAVLAVGIGLGAAAAGTLGAFLTNAAVDAGVGEGLAGLLVAGGSAIGIIVRLTAGALADRRGHGHLLRVAAMLALGALAYGAYALQQPLALVLATPVAFGAGWGWPGLFNLAIVRSHPDAPGAASGITQTGTYLGAVAGPVLFGVIAQRWSYSWAWLVAGALSFSAAIAIIAGRAVLIRHRTRAEAQAQEDAAAAGVVPAL